MPLVPPGRVAFDCAEGEEEGDVLDVDEAGVGVGASEGASCASTGDAVAGSALMLARAVG